MFDNHLYNLMAQMTEEHKSLWRIKNMYMKDAGDCADCTAFWKKMEQSKEEYIGELQELVMKHMG